ncbi:MAG: peptide chain release factor aRF-1 [Thaumarchaeota archaeon]|nr:peptide chain release factor aRF-1 [Nitrososphaerota archaeon]
MVSKVDSIAIYKTRKLLAEISNKKGRGTELVSLYVPPRKPLHEVSTTLRGEHGTASNIKSDTTRNHVQDALVKCMQRLKLYKTTPENGIVLFCGALPTNGPGSEAIFVYEITPPKPVQTFLYRCDDHFNVEPLRDMLREEKIVGILSVDSSEAGLAIVAGDKMEIVENITSGVSGKHRAGGQSARRFERMREMELTSYFHRVARHASKAFLDDYRVHGLIVGGPGPTKDDFLKGDYLDYRLKNGLLGVLDTSYAGREGVRETLDKADQLLQDMRLMEEKKLVKRFLQEVHAPNGLAAYGLNDILNGMSKASVDTVLIADDLGLTHLSVICNKCGDRREAFLSKEVLIAKKQEMISEACKQCSGTEYETFEEDVVDYLASKGLESGVKIEVISSKTEEGVMLKSFGGIGAILRYKPT